MKGLVVSKRQITIRTEYFGAHSDLLDIAEMRTFTVAPSPWKDDLKAFFILQLGPIKVFLCQPGHHWPRHERYLQFRVKTGESMEKWTVSIWHDDAAFGKCLDSDSKDIVAAWSWYKRHRKEKCQILQFSEFSLSWAFYAQPENPDIFLALQIGRYGFEYQSIILFSRNRKHALYRHPVVPHLNRRIIISLPIDTHSIAKIHFSQYALRSRQNYFLEKVTTVALKAEKIVIYGVNHSPKNLSFPSMPYHRGNQHLGAPDFENFNIALFRAGDPDCFKFVFTLLNRSVFKYAVSLLQSEKDAADLVSQAFYQLFHARNSMHSLADIINWLIQTTKSSASLVLFKRDAPAIGSKTVQNQAPTLPTMADWLKEAAQVHKLNWQFTSPEKPLCDAYRLILQQPSAFDHHLF